MRTNANTPKTCRRLARRRWLGFVRNRRGTTAVEFAFLSIPFILLVGGILEIGLIAMSSASLKNGVREAARLGRVGTAACMSQGEMQTLICSNSPVLRECESRLAINRKRIDGWGGDSATQVGGDDFDNVSGGDIIVASAKYEWKILAPFISEMVGDTNGNFTFQQSFAYQAEPFGQSDCGNSS